MRRKKILLSIMCLLLLIFTACNNGDLAKDQVADGTISSDLTIIPSEQYPHTQAIPIQPAQYDFIEVNPERQHPETEQGLSENQDQPAEGISDIEVRVVELTNAERESNGIAALQMDTDLTGVAQEKSNDMQANNYFSHTSPTYGSPFDMIRDMGVSFHTAGENIAQGQPTPEQVVEAWMQSEGHRQNILNEQYTHIGVGYNPNGNHWTQMFISR